MTHSHLYKESPAQTLRRQAKALFDVDLPLHDYTDASKVIQKAKDKRDEIKTSSDCCGVVSFGCFALGGCCCIGSHVFNFLGCLAVFMSVGSDIEVRKFAYQEEQEKEFARKLREYFNAQEKQTDSKLMSAPVFNSVEKCGAVRPL